MHETIGVESDALRDATQALAFLHAQLLSAVVDPYAWKWALLMLHHTIQLFIAATLEDGGAPDTGSAPHLRVLRSLAARPRSTEQDDLPELFERLERAGVIQPNQELRRDIELLSRYRDIFVHDLPTRWELDIRALPGIARNGLRLVDHLGWSSGGLRGESVRLAEIARAKVVASVTILDALERQYRT